MDEGIIINSVFGDEPGFVLYRWPVASVYKLWTMESKSAALFTYHGRWTYSRNPKERSLLYFKCCVWLCCIKEKFRLMYKTDNWGNWQGYLNIYQEKLSINKHNRLRFYLQLLNAWVPNRKKGFTAQAPRAAALNRAVFTVLQLLSA